MNYMKKVEEFFWSNLEDDELQVNDDNCDILDQAIRLMEIDDDSIANKEIENSNELKSLFGFIDYEILNKIEGFSSDESEDPQEDVESSDSEVQETFRTDKQQDASPPSPKKEEKGETSESKNPEERESRKRKGNFYPFNTEAKNTTNIFGSNILNIDGKANRKELIDTWAKEISLIIQTNKEAYDDQNTVLLLVEHKSTGVVNSFIKLTNWEPRMNPLTAFDEVLDGIYTMFLGINLSSDKIQELYRIRSKAKTMLTNMQLCDICFLDQFYCDYEKYLYQLGEQGDYLKHIQDYLLKIPLVGQKALDRFNLEATGTAAYSLGYAHRIVKEEISKICDLTRKQKQLKSFSKRTCDKITEQPFEYGCRKSYKKSYKSKSSKAMKTYRFRKKKKSFKPGKYVKRKAFDKTPNKQKFCPKGKKNCRCWICSEEGHYANECPNRRKFDNKVKLLEEISSNGFIPVEDCYDGELTVYQIEEIDPDPSDSESSDASTSDSS